MKLRMRTLKFMWCMVFLAESLLVDLNTPEVTDRAFNALFPLVARSVHFSLVCFTTVIFTFPFSHDLDGANRSAQYHSIKGILS